VCISSTEGIAGEGAAFERRKGEAVIRRIRRLAILLLLGACINVALAMAFIWLDWVIIGSGRTYPFHGTTYEVQTTRGLTVLHWWPMSLTRADAESGQPPAWSRLHQVPRPFASADFTKMRAIAARTRGVRGRLAASITALRV
jgi:hypothetical protein